MLCTPEALWLPPRCAWDRSQHTVTPAGAAVASQCVHPLHTGKGETGRDKTGCETALWLPCLLHVLQFLPWGRQTFPSGKDRGLHGGNSEAGGEASASEQQPPRCTAPATCAPGIPLLPAPAPAPPPALISPRAPSGRYRAWLVSERPLLARAAGLGGGGEPAVGERKRRGKRERREGRRRGRGEGKGKEGEWK